MGYLIISIRYNAARVQRLRTSRTLDRKQYTASRVAKELLGLVENPGYITAKATKVGRIIQAVLLQYFQLQVTLLNN